MTAGKPNYPYNYLKLLILFNIGKMSEEGTKATSKDIQGTLLEHGRNKSLSNITTSLRHYTQYGYLKRTPTPLSIQSGGQSCAFTYKLTAKGSDALDRMLSRLEHGLELNLKRRIELRPVEFNKYK